MTTLDDLRLRASAMNSLAHGAEALYTPLANPVATLVALRGAELLAAALDRPAEERDRAALALGSLLCAYALDSAGFALHHVVCQTLVWVLGTPHAETNATMLPLTMEAMRARAPDGDRVAGRGAGNGRRPGSGERIEALGGGPRRLGDLGAERGRLEAGARRDPLPRRASEHPDPPGREELERLLEAAW